MRTNILMLIALIQISNREKDPSYEQLSCQTSLLSVSRWVGTVYLGLEGQTYYTVDDVCV